VIRFEPINIPQPCTVIIFAAIGAGLKIIDDTFDEGVFDKRLAGIIAPALVVMALILSISDAAAATVLLSILLAVIFAGKVDNLIFKINAFAFSLLFCITASFDLLWMHLLALTIAGVVDEKGNDFVDRHDAPRPLKIFFVHRCMMKVCMLLLCVLSLMPWLYFFALLAFDLSYDSIKLFSDHKKEKRAVTAES